MYALSPNPAIQCYFEHLKLSIWQKNLLTNAKNVSAQQCTIESEKIAPSLSLSLEVRGSEIVRVEIAAPEMLSWGLFEEGLLGGYLRSASQPL